MGGGCGKSISRTPDSTPPANGGIRFCSQQSAAHQDALGSHWWELRPFARIMGLWMEDSVACKFEPSPKSYKVALPSDLFQHRVFNTQHKTQPPAPKREFQSLARGPETRSTPTPTLPLWLCVSPHYFPRGASTRMPNPKDDPQDVEPLLASARGASWSKGEQGKPSARRRCGGLPRQQGLCPRASARSAATAAISYQRTGRHRLMEGRVDS